MRIVAFFDQRHPSLLVDIARPFLLDLQQETAVDFVNNLQQSRQQMTEQPDRPSLESLRQQRMIGVGHAAGGDLPRGIPAQAMFVHQQSHQFRNGAGRMRIVQLETILFRRNSVKSSPCWLTQ